MNQQQRIIALGGASAAVVLIGIFLLYRKKSRDSHLQEDELENKDKSELDFADLNTEEVASAGQTVVEVKVPPHIVGGIIGKAGVNIKKLKAEFGVRFDFDREEVKDGISNTEKKDRNLVIRGEREKVLAAEIRIKEIIANTPKHVETEMFVPQESCGRIIGKGGQSIRELCSVSGAKIIVDRNEDRSLGNQRRIFISGTSMQVDYAKLLIEEKVEQDKAAAQKYKTTAPTHTSNFMKYLNDFPVASLPDEKNYFQVFVSALLSPDHFWIQVVSTESVKLDVLTKELTEYYGKLEQTEQRLQQGKVGDICVAPFEFDNQWYRACITGVNANGTLDLYYIDFGDSNQVNINDVKAIREKDLDLPAHARECYLPIKPNSFTWTKEEKDHFEALSHCAQWVALMAKIIGYKNVEGKSYPVLELIDTSGEKDINIAHAMVTSGHASEELKDYHVVDGSSEKKKVVQEDDISVEKASLDEFIKNNVSGDDLSKPINAEGVAEVLSHFKSSKNDHATPQKSADEEPKIEDVSAPTESDSHLKNEPNPMEQRSDVDIESKLASGSSEEDFFEINSDQKEISKDEILTEETVKRDTDDNRDKSDKVKPGKPASSTFRQTLVSDEFVDIDVTTVNGAITAVVSEHFPVDDENDDFSADDKTIVNEEDIDEEDEIKNMNGAEEGEMLDELQKSLDETSRKNVLTSMEMARENLVAINFDDSSLSNNDSFMSARSELTVTDDTNSFMTPKSRLTPDITVSLPDLSSSGLDDSKNDLTPQASPNTRRSSGNKFEIQFIDESTNRVMSRESLSATFETSLTKDGSPNSAKGKETTV